MNFLIPVENLESVSSHLGRDNLCIKEDMSPSYPLLLPTSKLYFQNFASPKKIKHHCIYTSVNTSRGNTRWEYEIKNSLKPESRIETYFCNSNCFVSILSKKHLISKYLQNRLLVENFKSKTQVHTTNYDSILKMP